MTKYTQADVNEAFFNIGRISAKLESKDDGVRISMLAQIIGSFLTQVIEENRHLKGEK